MSKTVLGNMVYVVESILTTDEDVIKKSICMQVEKEDNLVDEDSKTVQELVAKRIENFYSFAIKLKKHLLSIDGIDCKYNKNVISLNMMFNIDGRLIGWLSVNGYLIAISNVYDSHLNLVVSSIDKYDDPIRNEMKRLLEKDTSDRLVGDISPYLCRYNEKIDDNIPTCPNMFDHLNTDKEEHF